MTRHDDNQVLPDSTVVYAQIMKESDHNQDGDTFNDDCDFMSTGTFKSTNSTEECVSLYCNVTMLIPHETTDQQPEHYCNIPTASSNEVKHYCNISPLTDESSIGDEHINTGSEEGHYY